jgi:signal transduction histidine kinase
MSDAARAFALFSVVAVGVATLAALRFRRRQAQARLVARSLHELRGGVAALELGLAAFERSGELRPDLERWAEALRGPLERTKLGVSDLDALCRGGGPSPTPSEELVDLAGIVLQSARAWSRLAPSYGALLHVDWRAGPVRVCGHGARLRQALDNLIANALEHGGGRVAVESERCGDHVRVAISDGGNGLSATAKLAAPPRTRLREAPSRSPRGHGLAIALDVIEAHGGKLVVGSGPRGAALTVELPIEKPHDDQDVPRRARARSQAARVGVGSRGPRAA